MAGFGMEPKGMDSAAPSSSQDPFLYRLLVAGLVAGVLCTIIGGIILAGIDRSLPGELIALGSVCAGGLVGLLAPSPIK